MGNATIQALKDLIKGERCVMIGKTGDGYRAMIGTQNTIITSADSKSPDRAIRTLARKVEKWRRV